jgi:dephospho-CoA kinase
MIRVGVTGGIGSGKSIVCRIFSLLGAPVYNADDAAKRLMNNDPQIKNALTDSIGNIYNPDGTLNRKKLAGKIFENEVIRKKVNEIVHPAVISDYRSWEAMQQYPYVVKESAILFESGTNAGLDVILTVTAPEDLRIKRVSGRDERSEKEIKSIISTQMSDEERLAGSDYNIVNDGITALLPQIWTLHSKFTGDE